MNEGVIVLGGRYKVYRDGKVTRMFGEYEGEEYKPSLRNGYPSVCWYEDGKQRYQYLHVLVAAAFLPNPCNLPKVRFKDGNKLNVSSDNLEWATQETIVRSNLDGGKINYMKNGTKCRICGQMTRRHDAVCPDCARKLDSALSDARRRQNRAEKYSAFTLDRLTARQAQIVGMLSKGFSECEVAEAIGVSRQSVRSAVESAEKKQNAKPIPRGVIKDRLVLVNRVDRYERRVGEAKAELVLLENQLENTKARLMELDRIWGIEEEDDAES